MNVQTVILAIHLLDSTFWAGVMGRLSGHLQGIRGFLVTTVVAAIVALMPCAAFGLPTFSDWPSRGVKIIVPFPAGSANDTAARMYAQGLSRRWARPVVVENRANTDTDISAVLVRAAFADADDDHTLLYATASMVMVDPLLQRGARSVPDLIPIAAGSSVVIVVAVADHVPARTLKELVALARSKPGELSWRAGPSLPYFAFAATVRRYRLDMPQVRDAATSAAELNAGRVHVLCNALHALAGPVGEGKLRILAVTSPQREAMLPDVPTVAEAGFPEMEIEGLAGLFGGRRVPPEVRDRIATDMRAVAADPGFHDWFSANGQRVRTGTPAEFAAAIGRQRIRLQQFSHIVDPRSVLLQEQ
jgi:tripartite-type tricarboxylate transporter receptor subunit TctC